MDRKVQKASGFTLGERFASHSLNALRAASAVGSLMASRIHNFRFDGWLCAVSATLRKRLVLEILRETKNGLPDYSQAASPQVTLEAISYS